MGFVRVVPDGREIRTHLSNANFGARHRLRGLAGRRGDGGCPTRRAGGRGCPATDDVRDVRVVPDRKQIRTHRVEAGFAAPRRPRRLAGRGGSRRWLPATRGGDQRAADVPTADHAQSERSERREALWVSSVVVENVVCGGRALLWWKMWSAAGARRARGGSAAGALCCGGKCGLRRAHGGRAAGARRERGGSAARERYIRLAWCMVHA